MPGQMEGDGKRRRCGVGSWTTPRTVEKTVARAGTVAVMSVARGKARGETYLLLAARRRRTRRRDGASECGRTLRRL